jgi:hypothetical protein
MMRPTVALRRWCLRLAGVLVLSGGRTQVVEEVDE